MARRPCSICGDPATGHGWCMKHYTRWRRYGDPLFTKLLVGISTEERFWSKVNKHGPIPEHRPELGPCWVWADALLDGYGLLWTGTRQVKAHHWAYEQFVGPIPEGREPDHLCRNRGCPNPGHLEVVTKRENILRGEGMGARYARRTHCKNDHLFDEANTIWRGNTRVCRACKSAEGKRYYQRRKERAA